MALDAAWTRIEPQLPARMMMLVSAFVRQLASISAGGDLGDVDELLDDTLAAAPAWPKKDRQKTKALISVLGDLGRQGWAFKVAKDKISLRPPVEIEADATAEKERVRRQELLKRDEQLSEPAVRQFILEMERKRLHNGRFVSIFSLMRDGRELATSLRTARSALVDGSIEPLTRVIAPYIQFVAVGERCEWTGLLLQDIWRYFRHTWSNQYVSVPGRTMMVIVRDAAVALHPVIGIGALSSPVVQIKERDEWIGWHPARFMEYLRAEASPRLAKWLTEVVDRSISEIYVADFLAEPNRFLTPAKLRRPTPELIDKLRAESLEARARHHRYAKAKDYKSNQSPSIDGENKWESKAASDLFRSKRALALSEMLNARLVLSQHLGERPSRAKLLALLDDTIGDQVVRRILRKAKGDRVGIAMADISVCGAVAPYNPVLGGKLVSMLLTSPEVVRAYHDRYRDAESEIASSIAGRPIIRPPQLVFLGTTSLYGIGSSQYNRLKLPCDLLGGKPGEAIEYLRLGMSEAFGTSQYSDETVDELVAHIRQENGGERVNHIFGEGVSPKMRKVREGLEALELPSELFLRHGRHRIVYGVSLVRNLRDYLLGLEKRPDFLIPTKDPLESTRRIALWWASRWLKGRIQSDDVLDQVQRHTLVHPIRHGGRVPVPATAKHDDVAMVESSY